MSSLLTSCLFLLWAAASLFCTSSANQSPFVGNYLSTDDKTALARLFRKNLASIDPKSVDISVVHHAVGGLKFLGEQVSAQDAQKYCDMAKKVDSSDVKSLYHATAVAAYLPPSSCQLSFANARSVLESAVKEDQSTTAQLIYYALSAAEKLKIKLNQDTVDVSLQNALKKDDGVLSLSYGLNAAIFLDETKTKTYFDRIEDLVGQADEIDSKYLQFEGGLSVTATGIYAIYALADRMGKSPSVKSDESVKFANYLMSRRGVHMERGAYLLLRAVEKMTRNKFQLPVVFTLDSPMAVRSGASKVVVRVCNLLGSAVQGALNVYVDSATHTASSGVVLSRKPLTKVANDNTNTLYEFDFLEQSRERGFYRLSLSAGSQDKRLVGTIGAQLTVKVLTDIVLEDSQIGVFDRELSQPINMQSVAVFSKLGRVLEADSHQKIAMQFSVRERQTSKLLTVHQAFVVFVHSVTKQEVIFVAEPDPKTSLYFFEVDLQKSAKDFEGLSGKYHIRLIIGDAVITNAVDWTVADVNLQLPAIEAKKVKKSEQISYNRLPEIKHLFKEPEKLAPVLISNTFTVICLSPLLLLLVLWFRIGLNFDNFTFSLWTLGFHAGLAGVYGLYFMFWLRLNMFVTLKYLAGIGGLTFVCGNRMLKSMAQRRKQKTE